MYQKTDFDALRRAANANLVKLSDGTIKRQMEQERERARRQREFEKTERKERRERLIELKRSVRDARNELKEHQKEWSWLYDMTDEQLKEVGDFTVPNLVVLEEVDATRDKLVEKVNDLEDELWFIERQ